MAKSTYRITSPSSKTILVIAKTRAEAIGKYCRENGIPRQFFDDHCRIKREGVADADENKSL